MTTWWFCQVCWFRSKFSYVKSCGFNNVQWPRTYIYLNTPKDHICLANNWQIWTFSYRGDEIKSPAAARYWTNASLMLVHRRRRWTNIKPALVQCIVVRSELFCCSEVFFSSQRVTTRKRPTTSRTQEDHDVVSPVYPWAVATHCS